MSKMAEFLRPTMRPIGLSIKKNPIENGLKLREREIRITDFVTEITKHHFLNMTYVDISISDIVSTPECIPGFLTVLNTNLTLKSSFETN